MNFLAATNLLAAKPGWNLLQSYMYFGALAFISEGLGDATGAARWAQDALKSAATTSSPFPRHRSRQRPHHLSRRPSPTDPPRRPK